MICVALFYLHKAESKQVISYFSEAGREREASLRANQVTCGDVPLFTQVVYIICSDWTAS